MTSLTVRNVPEDAKRRFRQVAAAHGRSMEEHLRQMIIEADFGDVAAETAQQGVRDVTHKFRHFKPDTTPAPHKPNWVEELIRLADGAGDELVHQRKYAEIRFMTAKDAMAELRRLATILILVDTNVWSELAKPRGDPAVLAWLEANDDDLALSTLVIAEIRFGVELLAAPEKQAFLAAWLDGLQSRYYGQTWRFDSEDAYIYGRIAALPEVKARKPQVIDIQLAAQALARGAAIATRNVRDFDWAGVELVNPWNS
jgi:toxin FitB